MTGQDDTKPTRRRWHRSTWVFVSLCAVALIALNVPAYDVYSFVVDGDGQYGPDFRNFGYHFEHGWPISYLWQEPYVSSHHGGGMGGYASIPVSRWDFSTGVIRVSLLGLGANVVFIGLGIMVLGMLIEVWCRRRQNVWQFSLRDLGLFVAVLAVPLGFVAGKLAEHQRDVEVVSAFVKEDGTPVAVKETGIWQPPKPAWLSLLFGDRLDRIVQLEIGTKELAAASQLTALQSLSLWFPSNQQLKHLETYPRLEGLRLWGGPSNEPEQVDSEGFTIEPKFRLPNLPRLRGLNMYETAFNGDGLEHLTGLEVLCLIDTQIDDQAIPALLSMKQLRVLWLDNTKLTSHGIRALSQLERLEELSLGRTAVDDETVRTLLPLQKLQSLSLDWTEVTDASVPVLKQFAQLKYLDVSHSKMTTQGVQELQQAMPNCNISGP